MALKLHLAMTTIAGLSRVTVRTRMPDGASLTTPSRPGLTITKSTPGGSRLTTTSGLRNTIRATTVMPTPTARLPHTGARMVSTATATARPPMLLPELVLTTT